MKSQPASFSLVRVKGFSCSYVVSNSLEAVSLLKYKSIPAHGVCKSKINQSDLACVCLGKHRGYLQAYGCCHTASETPRAEHRHVHEAPDG